jgi:hypothetical protein
MPIHGRRLRLNNAKELPLHNGGGHARAQCGLALRNDTLGVDAMLALRRLDRDDVVEVGILVATDAEVGVSLKAMVLGGDM